MVEIQGKEYYINKTCSIQNISDHSITYIKSDTYLTKKLMLELEDKENLLIFYPKLKHNSREIHLFIQKDININITWVQSEFPENDFSEIHNQIYESRNIYREGISKKATFFNIEYIFGYPIYIGPGAVIGTQGLKLFLSRRKLQTQLTHVGGVKLGDEVIIKSACIDRANFEKNYTELEDNVFVDNFVHVAHNSLIKKNSVIIAGSIIGGSSVIGKNCFLGLGSIIKNHVEIGDNVEIGMGSVVINDIGDNEKVGGNYAVNRNKWLRFHRYVKDDNFAVIHNE